VAQDDTQLEAFVQRHLPMHLRSTYGGNTTCVEVQTPDSLIIIDCGSGFRELGIDLERRWKALADELLATDYRAAMSSLTGFDLSAAPLEVNVFHYPPGGLLGAHPDLEDKIVTHVFYFNRLWNDDDGGCLSILRSSDPADVVTTISPVVGNSAVLVRSDNSWHAVSPVVKSCRLSRRSLTATFYHPGSVSTMWPPDDNTPLHHYPKNRLQRWWGKLTQ